MGVFLKVFLIILLSQLSNGAQHLMSVEESDNKIPEYIRELIKDFNKKDSNIHDVVIIDLENEKSENLLNKIIMEIPEENPVILPNVNANLKDNYLRQASLVIIIANNYNFNNLFFNGQNCYESYYFLNTAKFIFIGTKSMTDDDYYEISFLFDYIGIFNVVILNENNGELVIKSLNPHIQENAVYSLEYNTDIDYVYPDKLSNMKGYPYLALAFAQKPRLSKLSNGEFRGIDVKFMQTVAEKQNTTFVIGYYEEVSDDSFFENIYYPYLINKRVDMSLNTAVVPIDERNLKTFKLVNTFDVNGYCALIPYPPRTSFLGQMLTPFDSYTWIVFMISIGTCVIIWKMFNLMGNGREDSALYFMYGIIAHFLLQTIPFRNNRIIQRSLLQICIFMTFILGNAYQSLIISFISESRYGPRIKSFDELMQSNYSLKVDPLFYYMLNSTDDAPENYGKFSFVDTFVNYINYQQEAANNTAIVLTCDVAEFVMFSDEYNSNAIDYFYLLSEQIYSTYESFPTSKFSPYYEKLQYFSELIFESGIRQYWKEFVKYDKRGKIEANKISNEKYLINFDDLFGVFYLLGIGFICAIMVLIFEIFWHDCLRHLNREMILQFLMKKKEQKKMKVRRIQVKPMERIEVKPMERIEVKPLETIEEEITV